MNATYSFYINHTKVNPSNAGSLSITRTLQKDKGGRYYTTELSEDIKLQVADYRKLALENYFESLPVKIVEHLNGVDTTVFVGVTARSRGEGESKHKQQISLKVKSMDAVGLLLANGEKPLNLMRVEPAIDYEYNSLPKIEYRAFVGNTSFQSANFFRNLPYWGDPVFFASGASAGGIFLVYSREVVTVYNQAGESRKPDGNGWVKLLKATDERNTTSWYRKPALFDPVPNGTIYFTSELDPAGNPPTIPAAPNGEIWRQIGEETINNITGRIYVDDNAVKGEQITLNNGRYLEDTLRYALKQTNQDFYFFSKFLTDETNYVTGLPNEVKDTILHSSQDVKAPLANAAQFSRILEFTTLGLLESICNRFNLYWYMDSMSNQLVLEHISYSKSSGLLNIDEFLQESPDVEYLEGDLVKFEELKTLSKDIDFSGTPIENLSDFASGTTSIDSTGLMTDVFDIYQNPSNYSDDILVLVQPKSLEFDGELVEEGAITGDYKPNAALSQANLNKKYAPFWRKVPYISLNFNTYQATVAPFRKIPTIYHKSLALSQIVGLRTASSQFFEQNGEIESISFNLGSQIAAIEVNF